MFFLGGGGFFFFFFFFLGGFSPPPSFVLHICFSTGSILNEPSLFRDDSEPPFEPHCTFFFFLHSQFCVSVFPPHIHKLFPHPGYSPIFDFLFFFSGCPFPFLGLPLSDFFFFRHLSVSSPLPLPGILKLPFLNGLFSPMPKAFSHIPFILVSPFPLFDLLPSLDVRTLGKIPFFFSPHFFPSFFFFSVFFFPSFFFFFPSRS